MLSVITKYLTDLFLTLPYLSEALGMGESIDVDGVATPAYWSNGEPVHLNFDSHQSLIYIVKDGETNRDTIEHPVIATLEQVTETYPLKAIIYYKGAENINCSSHFQSIVEGVKKNISGRQSQLETSINAENIIVKVKKTNLNKSEVWKGISGGEVTPKEDDNFASIDFDVIITGDEQCFAGEPCQANDFVFSFPSQGFCEKVAECEVESNSLEFAGTGTATYVKSELIGKTLLLVATDGRIRKSSDYSFTSGTGTIVFISVIQTGQTVHIIYK